MNRENAIITLTNVASLLCDGTRYMKPEHEKQFREAYEMAIKALKQPERKRGKWHVIGNTGLASCECRYITDRYSTYKFCPNCGADMRGNTKRKGEPIEGNNESYNCENWIP